MNQFSKASVPPFRFVPASSADQPPLLLLHGTGGTEDDLLPLGREVSPEAALLSPRGAVTENGMPRFFRRLSEGVFDEDDLVRRTHDLDGFLRAAREQYHLAAPIALGFSNGANIAAALLLLHPETLAGAILIRPMMPFRTAPEGRLDHVPVLMLSGRADPIVPAKNRTRLAALLEQRGARLTHHLSGTGHGLDSREPGIIQAWLERLRTGP